jgi:hypothetical protein
MRKRMRRLVFACALACASLLLVSGGGGARTSNESFDLHVGDGFGPPLAAPSMARAGNGDTIEVVLTGAFNKRAKTASGGGTWTHRRGSTVLGSGTVTLTRTVALQFYGCGVAPDGSSLPPNFCGGRVILRAHFAGVDSVLGAEFNGQIEVNCQIHDPGKEPPPGTSEGVKVNTRGINFNKHVSGANLFVQTT